MAHSLSAEKRIRQNVKCRALNRARKAQVKSQVRAFSATLATGDAPKTSDALKAAIKKIDQTAAKGTLHKNTASRKKSQLQRKYNALVAAGK